ncbi:hypothetical protein Acr_16g0006440 [Actinidia rufa]|uniref:TRF2/HOY1 PH-like domain-containing protein n=1 Tax=Actinidia rufa TaxID=165716 RepID=A0A7J0G0Q5_9ERIC|nr:hypothetical protein Acr_16g0006440 [Actinidia rufa]
MVRLMNSSVEAPPESSRKKGTVKVEMEDTLEDQHGPLSKRSKLSYPHPLQKSDMGPFNFPIPPSQYNPLEEPSPLGLRLKKSPSLLDLIQMTLSKGNALKVGSQVKKEHNAAGTSAAADKLKASNFPASFLSIGTWEYKSRYEGDLVAKCYFAKHKLVWEVLDGGLKNKIEIQWSDIMALKANYPDDEPGTLDVVLARQPLFFRETNPQPRKHTLWQATSDFTHEQASMNRRHFLQCPQGLLGKHFEKLIQCDPRLNFLSQQGDIVLESPYFEPRTSVLDDSNEANHGIDLNSKEGQDFFAGSPSGAQSSAMTNERQDLVGRPRELFPRKTPSPSSGRHMNALLKIITSNQSARAPLLHVNERSGNPHRTPDLRTEKSNNFILSDGDRQSLVILDDISRCLFTDSEHASTSDEQCVMSTVNSLFCLLQKDSVTVQNSQVKGDNRSDAMVNNKRLGRSIAKTKVVDDFLTPEDESNPVSKQAPAMSRKDSVGELLLNLPRIASLPQFLFNISEDTDNQAR